jgi:hypothetical protein
VSTRLEESAPFIGLGGLFVAAFLYGYVAIALPSWTHSLFMPAFWLVLFVLACRWFTRRAYLVSALPVLAVVVWFVIMLNG